MLLSASAIDKSFAGVRALRGVSFDLGAGEVHALVGENGAGKSTLIKIMTGALEPDAGRLDLDGETVAALTPARARELGIRAIYQHPALFPDLSVTENLAMAWEDRRRWRRVDWRARQRRARDLLESLGAPIDPARLAGSLTMPEQQLVEIAKAVGASARVVVMDEPTASLTDREVEHLFSVIARLRASGVGIIYISHRLEEVFAIADRITVLRDGATVTTVARTGTTPGEIVHLMVGRALETSFPRRDVALGDVALEVRGLASHDAGLHDISLAVRRGEILALAGLVGSGRTELAEVIFGLRPLDAGRILLGGAAAAIHSPGDAIRLGVAYLPEDRLRHGVVPEMSVAANASLANLDAVSRHGIVDRAAEAAVAREYVERFRIRTPSVGAAVGALSGGNQQKVALARWLATRPAVLIVDEPTQGVDVGSKAEIHGLLQSLRERGLAILMISSELPEVLGMCDRVAVMRAGTIAGVLSRADATEERVLALALAVPAGTGATESAPPW